MYRASLFSITRAALVSILLSGFGFQSSALAVQSVTLTWNPSANTNVAGYKFYFGVTSLIYTNSIAVGNVTNTTITGLADGTTYDASGTESGFSNEASYQTGGTNVNVVSTNSTTNSDSTTNTTSGSI